jgi:periplasmic protein TonB
MMARNRDAGQHVSDAMALTLTSALVAMVLLGSRPDWMLQRPADANSTKGIELSVESAPVPTPAAPPPVIPRRAVVHHDASPPLVQVPDPVPPPAVEDPAVPDDASLAASAPAPAQQAASARATIEALYAAQLRADIDRRTHPPDSAQYRLHHPAGEVQVRFVVTRSGVLEACTRVRSSGSPLLDEAALAIVAAGHYPPMPAQAFAGEMEHAFTVTIEFRPAALVAGTSRT